MDFNIIKDISIDSIVEFMNDLIEVLEEKYWLKFVFVWWIGDWDYGYRSYSIKIKLHERWYIFNENVRIKFDFAIRPWFNKNYSNYKITNHYEQFFNKEIYCLCEDIDIILHDKFLALVWPEYRTEPKDFFDIVEVIWTGRISDEVISYIINQFNPILSNDRIENIILHWDEFFYDQLSYILDINRYINQYNYIINKYYKFNQ